MTVEFGDGSEPWSVSRGKVKRWLHCRIADVEALPEEQQAELADWLENRSFPTCSVLQIVRDQAGSHTLHIAGTVVELALADLPLWLQSPEAQPQSAPRTPTRRAKASS